MIFSENGILKRKLKSGLTVLMVPLLLIPFVLEAHWMIHSGAKKLSSIIKLQYWWKNMRFDIDEFSRGAYCVAFIKQTINQKLK